MTLLSPELLRATHQVDGFDCGAASLNSWLRDEALAEQQAGRSRTYVVCANDVVVGYYTVASGSVAHHLAVSGRVHIPDPMPVVVLRRLAVDQGYQGRQLGASLLRDALGRMVRAGRLIGCRAVVVDAPDDRARGFYARFGFSPSLPNQLKLTLTMDALRRAIGIS